MLVEIKKITNCPEKLEIKAHIHSILYFYVLLKGRNYERGVAAETAIPLIMMQALDFLSL